MGFGRCGGLRYGWPDVGLQRSQARSERHGAKYNSSFAGRHRDSAKFGANVEGADAAPPPPVLSQEDSTTGARPLGLASIAEDATLSTGTAKEVGRSNCDAIKGMKISILQII